MGRRPILWSVGLHLVILTILLVQVSFRKPQKVAPMIPIMVIPISDITASPRRAASKQDMDSHASHTKPKPETSQASQAAASSAEAAPAPSLIKKIERPKEIKPLQTKKELQELKKENSKSKTKEDDFEQLLKNLDKPVLHKKDVGTAKGPTIDSENIADKLSLSELDALRQQLQRCWNIPAGARNAENLSIDARVTVGPDAMVQNVELLDQARMRQDPFYRAAAESAKRALHHPECSPLKLPANKYHQWKVFMITFDPQEILR